MADFIGGLKSRTLAPLLVAFAQLSVGLLVIAVFLAVRGQAPPGLGELLPAAVSGVGGLVGITCLYRGMAVGSISIVAPITATSAAIPVTVGLATGDRPSAPQAIGLAMALVGVVLASREPGSSEGPRAAGGVGWAVLSAVGFGTFFVFMDSASDADPYWATLANRVVSVGLLAAVLLVLRPGPLPGRADLGVIAVIGVLDVAANMLFAVASTKGLVSVVATLAALYPVVTVILARLLLHERLAPSQQVGVLVALAGVGAISAG